ncbi:MAG TPA: lipid II flippase MurJ, partial [Ktedonobacterales bacterium]|nr:lipid II flippase MurJ [Ktedonobacterales bacterium]
MPQALPPFPEAGAAAGEAVQLVEMARDTSAADEQAAAGGRRRLIATAGVIAAGQLLSSVLGFVRIAVLNVLFYPVVSGTFLFALRPIQQINDLLVGGSVSGALIPTFVDYGEPASREELRRIYSTVANLVLICMCVAVPLLILAAPAIISLEIVRGGDSPQITIQLVRLASFSLIGLGLFAATSALLYALKQVVFPAFATGIYHVAIITCGVLALLLAAYQLHLP